MRTHKLSGLSSLISSTYPIPSSRVRCPGICINDSDPPPDGVLQPLQPLQPLHPSSPRVTPTKAWRRQSVTNSRGQGIAEPEALDSEPQIFVYWDETKETRSARLDGVGWFASVSHASSAVGKHCCDRTREHPAERIITRARFADQ